MLPKKLTMSAFGPYHKLVTIDFDHFIQNGLFLITGPTGSGKTMIFDAIMFALYGVSSGSERISEQFRSDQADNKRETFVELEFSLHQENYLIKRSPKYLLPGRKTPKAPQALLTMPNGKIIEGVKEVNQKIKELLSIDANQFKQIAMIAQGEFTKLIYASSEEREKVLRNLFKTDELEYLQEQLKEEVRQYKSKYDLLFNQRELLYRNLDLENSEIDLNEYLDQYHIKVENLQTLYFQKEEIVNQKNSELNQALWLDKQFKQLEGLETKLSDYQKQAENYQKLKNQIDDLKKARLIEKDYLQVKDSQKKIVELSNSKNEINQKLLDNQEKLEKQTTLYQQIPIYRQNLANDQIELDKLLEREKQFVVYLNDLKEEKEYRKQSRILESKNVELADKIEKYTRVIEKDSLNINRLESLKTDYKLTNQEYEKIHQRKLEIHTLNGDYDNYVLNDYKCCELREKYQNIEMLYQQEKERYDQIEHLYRLSQAGILASKLKENEPCPVCGSLEHPHLANFTGKLINDDDLKKAKNKFDQCRNQREDIYNDLILKQKETELMLKHLDENATRLGIDEELGKEVFIKVLASINLKEMQLLAAEKKINEEITYLKKLQISVKKYQKDVDSLNKQWQTNNNLIQEYQAKINQIIGRNSQNEYFKTMTMPSLKQQINDKQNQINSLQQNIKDIETTYLKSKENVIQLTSKLDTLTKQFAKEELLNKQYQEKYHHQLKKYFKDENSFISRLNDITQLETKEKAYQDYLIVKETLQKQIVQLKEELKDKKAVDLNQLKAKLDLLKVELKDLMKQLNDLKATYLTIQKTVNDILEIDQKLKQSYDLYQCYLDLSEVASGKNQYRVSFERYVLAAYFENILAYANVLLKRMAQGRYQLYRRDNRSKGNSKQGLELDVLDMESGMLRDVKTLSGGESFKAALSLALGLSKMIQDHAGGIELNTLFIDEGFGSLDSQSLDQAINCLMDLQQDGKLIGIISHVSELKDRIDFKIVLTRTNKETHITIE